MVRLAFLVTLLGLLPVAALSGDDDPPTPDQVRASIGRGVEFLLKSQNADGSWGGWHNPAVGIDEFWSNIETHRSWMVAITGLCYMALSEADSSDAARQACARGVDWLTANALVKRPSDWDTDNTWGYVYGLQALARAARDPAIETPARKAAIGRMVEALIQQLNRYQTPDGGWGYYDSFDSVTQPGSWSTSFMTANGVLALLDAREAGFEVDARRLAAAVRAIRRCRLPNGAFSYSVEAIPSAARLESINQVKGSLGRIHVCNLALMRAGEEVSEDRRREGVAVFFREHRFLDIARGKPIPHEAYYQNSGYFYYYAHCYAADVIATLPRPDRLKAWPRLQREVIKTQSRDGSMWDYPMNSHSRAYGTAFGILALQRSIADAEDLPPRGGDQPR